MKAGRASDKNGIFADVAVLAGVGLLWPDTTTDGRFVLLAALILLAALMKKM